jgi:GNAT superfamily N-acetyltransferase
VWAGLDPGLTFVAEVDGTIVGFSNGGLERSGDATYVGEVHSIYLLRAHQGGGLGRELFARAARALHEKGFSGLLVWVLSKNPSRGFYEHLGGEVVRTQPVTIFGAELEEVAYGWTDTAKLRS